MSSDPTAKVLFRIPGQDGGSTVETLWAIPLGNDLYKLDNSPFVAYGVSWQDIVLAPYNHEEQMPTFLSIKERSGNRTVRVIFDPPIAPGNSSDQIMQGLREIGCSLEPAHSGYVSVNVPPGIDLARVRSYLIANNAQWEHSDPTYESLFPDDA